MGLNCSFSTGNSYSIVPWKYPSFCLKMPLLLTAVLNIHFQVSKTKSLVSLASGLNSKLNPLSR